MNELMLGELEKQKNYVNTLTCNYNKLLLDVEEKKEELKRAEETLKELQLCAKPEVGEFYKSPVGSQTNFVVTKVCGDWVDLTCVSNFSIIRQTHHVNWIKSNLKPSNYDEVKESLQICLSNMGLEGIQ